MADGPGRSLDPLARAAAAVLGVIVLLALLAPLLAEQVLRTTPEQIMRDPSGRIATLRPPGPGYSLGTDEVGRDALTRLLYAGRVSLSIAAIVAAVSLLLGTAAGLAAGYYGGAVDDLVNAVVQLVLNVPALFLLILCSVLFRPDVPLLGLIMGLLFWPRTARQVRGVVQAARQQEFVAAARALGASDGRILARHVLPSVLSVVLVVAGLDVAAAILSESSLSFLGFGVQVPQASWGNMLSGSLDLVRRAPWLVYPPGLLILLTVLSVVLLSDGLRDALDPRHRRRGSRAARNSIGGSADRPTKKVDTPTKRAIIRTT
jgi:peptide/nickel transport system permease protein